MGKSINRLSLYFTGAKSVEVREETVPPLQSDQVLIRTLFSAISPGTELLIYRQNLFSGPLDTHIQSISGFSYPL
jgi:alcohol dehydrogenase